MKIKQFDKSALRIYYGAYLRALGKGSLIYIAVVCAIIWAINILFPGFLNAQFPYASGVLGGIVSALFSATIVAQARGMDALRQAGLLREADACIERISDDARGGPTIEMAAISAGKSVMIVGCLLLCAALVSVIFINPDSVLFHLACAVGALVMGGFAVAVWRGRNQPAVRLDDRGVFVCSDGLGQKLVPWRLIARARFQRVATAPSFGNFTFFEPDTLETIILENSEGKTLLALDGQVFRNAPATKTRFVAEIERRLTAATSQAANEEFDD